MVDQNKKARRMSIATMWQEKTCQKRVLEQREEKKK